MRNLSITELQLTLALIAWGLVRLFIFVKAKPGDLLDLSLFGIAIIDSILLTLCATGALGCLVAVLGLFRNYGYRSRAFPKKA